MVVKREMLNDVERGNHTDRRGRQRSKVFESIGALSFQTQAAADFYHSVVNVNTLAGEAALPQEFQPFAPATPYIEDPSIPVAAP